AVVAGGVEKGKLGIAKSGGGILTGVEILIQFVHKLGSRGVAYFPQAADDMVSASAEKSPRQADQPFASISFDTVAVASGNSDEISAERTLQDVASVELERVSFRGQDDGGFERLKPTGRAMCGEMDI